MPESRKSPVNCDEDLFDMISGPVGLMGELEDIADTAIPTIDELLMSLIAQCTQNSFNKNSITLPQFSSETMFTNHVRQLQTIDTEITFGLCSVMLS